MDILEANRSPGSLLWEIIEGLTLGYELEKVPYLKLINIRWLLVIRTDE